MARLILLTGATGYVGGRLLPLLERRGLTVRCVARRPEELRARVSPAVEVVAGDVLDRASLDAALAGVDTAYYLVHALGTAVAFEDEERLAARNFAQAARAAGVRRIVYLGGLADTRGALSPHLATRVEVGEILRASGVPTLELRASAILGSGSLSFDMVRALTERLPVLVTPRWVRNEAQPIFVGDVLAYLLAAIDHPLEASAVYEIGGADVVTYAELMREYARQRGLRRWMIPVPVLTPRISALWLGLVTPLYARVGRKLVESLSHPTVVRDPRALADFPIRPLGVRAAIQQALRNEEAELAATRWSDALSAGGPGPRFGGRRFGSRLTDSREVEVELPPEQAFAPIRRIGGERGWYAANWLWRARGALDLLAGGVGMRRGRRDPERLRVGDALDFWRVEAYEPDARLLLRAEMKLPGRAWLEFAVTPSARGSRIRQTAVYDPLGLLGLAYWYAVWPLHALVFRGMLKGVAARARADAPAPPGAHDDVPPLRRAEGPLRQAQQHDGVLATREQRAGPLVLGRHLAQDVDRSRSRAVRWSSWWAA